MSHEDLKARLEKQDKRAAALEESLKKGHNMDVPLEKDAQGDIRPPAAINAETFDEMPKGELLSWHPPLRDTLLHLSTSIAVACLGSSRHYTLNDGFAKQCVEFAKALRKESGFNDEENQS